MKIDSTHLKIKTFAFSKIRVESWWNFKNHISPFARIFLIQSGNQQVSFHGQTFHQQKGSLALIPPYTPVSYHCENYCNQFYFIFTCVLPNGRDLFADCKFPYELKADPWCFQLCERLLTLIPDFGLSNVDADSKDFNQMIFSSPVKNLSLQQKFAAQGTLSLLMSNFAEKATKSEQLIRFTKAFQYIEKNLHEDLSLGKLSELENMSKTYFSDQFYQHTGIRPTEYIAQKRETKARELLTSTHQTLTEIATQIGIPDLGYFSRFFKKRVGVPPKKYRLAQLMSQTQQAKTTAK